MMFATHPGQRICSESCGGVEWHRDVWKNIVCRQVFTPALFQSLEGRLHVKLFAQGSEEGRATTGATEEI